jgi:hypothetical protein
MLDNCAIRVKQNHAVVECPNEQEYKNLMKNQSKLIALFPDFETVSIKLKNKITTLHCVEYRGLAPIT